MSGIPSQETHVRALRQTLGHKARAVPDSAYTQAGEAPRSVKPLTEPMSPMFRSDLRLRSSAMQ
ncbi:hypothetical protein T484DRAFT_1768919 [Baffinella frigidus]|nr:hypothetical protein T484DRAFT_1768919 [Cryptophyta sp. CCMP2293]